MDLYVSCREWDSSVRLSIQSKLIYCQDLVSLALQENLETYQQKLVSFGDAKKQFYGQR